jgi:hypothetical protein
VAALACPLFTYDRRIAQFGSWHDRQYGAREALLDLQAIERGVGKPPWRDLLKELRHDRGRFGAVINDRSAGIALRWARRDLGLADRAGRRCSARAWARRSSW